MSMKVEEQTPTATKRRLKWLRKFVDPVIGVERSRRFRDHAWKIACNNWYLGKYIELRGDVVNFRGLKIALDNPGIATRSKSSFLLGAYENDEIAFSQSHLIQSLPTVELGASIGVVACVTNVWLGRTDQHVVVEANPTIVSSLLKNKQLNKCRFKIVSAAVGGSQGLVPFVIHDEFIMSSLSGEGDRVVLVPTIRLADLLKQNNFDRINLQLDVEGAELTLVEEELETIRGHVVRLIMETHARYVGEEANARMLRLLEEAGLERVETAKPDSDVVVYRNRALEDA